MKLFNILSHNQVYSIFEAGYKNLIEKGLIEILPSLENSFITTGNVNTIYDIREIPTREDKNFGLVVTKSSFELMKFEKATLHVEFEQGVLSFAQFTSKDRKFNHLAAIEKLKEVLKQEEYYIKVSVDEFENTTFKEYYQIYDSSDKLIAEDKTDYHNHDELKQIVNQAIENNDFNIDDTIQDNSFFIVPYPYFFI